MVSPELYGAMPVLCFALPDFPEFAQAVSCGVPELLSAGFAMLGPRAVNVASARETAILGRSVSLKSRSTVRLHSGEPDHDRALGSTGRRFDDNRLCVERHADEPRRFVV